MKGGCENSFDNVIPIQLSIDMRIYDICFAYFFLFLWIAFSSHCCVLRRVLPRDIAVYDTDFIERVGSK